MYVFLIIILVIGLVVWLTYNSLITAKVRVSEAFAQIDVQLKRRSDLIPNLVATVKGYAKHEAGVLEAVTQARTNLMNATDVASKAKANNQLADTLKSLFAVAENYPDLKASQNFAALQEELSDTENKVAYSRQFYNNMVMDYNTKLRVFPTIIFANILKFQAEDFFATTEEEKQAVKVAF